jgi:hypothetical protein
MMIEKFHPLPDGWREMYDAGTGRHYYWSVKYLLSGFVDPDRFGSASFCRIRPIRIGISFLAHVPYLLLFPRKFHHGVQNTENYDTCASDEKEIGRVPVHCKLALP